MTGQQLRNSILQEAIQGRLVPNVLEPGEKTGAELLQQILKERQDREDKENSKKAKKLTLSTIEEEPWELPEGWCWCKLGDVISLQSGRDLEPDKYNASNKGIPYITGASNFDRGSIIINRWTLNPVSVSNRGDLLITCKGTVGELAFNTVGDVHIARQIMAISAIIVDANYIQVFLKAKVNDLNAQANGVIPGISRDDILFADFPLPPLSIQKAIVAKIEELFPLVDEYDKASGELETLNKILPDKLRKSVLQEAIHGNLVPNDIPEGEATGAELLQQILKERQDRENKEKGKKAKRLTLSTIEEEPWELPEGWCWARLGDVMTFVNGRAYKKEELLSSGKYKVLRVGNFFTNDSWYYSDLELPEEKYCFKGDLLYAWSASFGPRIWEGDKTIFHYHIWNVKFNENKLFKKYLYWFFEADKHIIKESTTGSTMVHVSMENMMPRMIPIPPLSIQRSIVEKIEDVFAAIDNLPA